MRSIARVGKGKQVVDRPASGIRSPPCTLAEQAAAVSLVSPWRPSTEGLWAAPRIPFRSPTRCVGYGQSRPAPAPQEAPLAAAPPPPQLPATVTAEHTSLQFPGQPEWIAPAVEYLARKAVLCGACQEARLSKVTIALHEALTNAVIHGNLELSSDLKERDDNVFAEALAARATDPVLRARMVDVRIDYDGTCCRWTITDQGKGFDVQRVLRCAAGDGPEAILASGRGVLLMRAFLDDVQYEEGGRRVVLTLSKHSGAEQRQHGRLALQKAVRVAPIRADGSVDWDAAYEAVSHNLSAGGMGLLQEGLAATGRVLLALDWEGRTLYLPAEVRHCQSLGGNTVEIGCRFQADAPLCPGS